MKYFNVIGAESGLECVEGRVIERLSTLILAKLAVNIGHVGLTNTDSRMVKCAMLTDEVLDRRLEVLARRLVLAKLLLHQAQRIGALKNRIKPK